MRSLLAFIALLGAAALAGCAARSTTEPAPVAAPGPAPVATNPVEPEPLPSGHPDVADETAVSVTASPALPADVATPESVVAAYYATMSGEGVPPGEDREWGRFLSLFMPGARLVSVVPGPAGGGAVELTPERFVEMNRRYFTGSGYTERSTAQGVDAFENVAQVRSAYESRRRGMDEPYAGGVNFFQLARIDRQWKIVGVVWDRGRSE